MADKKTTEPEVTSAEIVEEASHVLHAYRTEKVGNDANLFERIELPDDYANEPGVKKFEAPNGQVTYYIEKLVRKFSDNVVTDESA